MNHRIVCVVGCVLQLMALSSVASCQSDVIQFLQLNCSGFRKVDVLIKQTVTRETSEGLPSSTETAMRLFIDQPNQMAVLLAVTSVEGSRQYFASKCRGNQVEIRVWPDPVQRLKLDSFEDCLKRGGFPILDFVGVSVFPMELATPLAENTLKAKDRIWEGILTKWASAKTIFSDRSVTTYQSPKFPDVESISELTISNDSNLPQHLSTIRIDPKDPNNRIRLFAEKYEWAKKNGVDIPTKITHEGRELVTDATGKKSGRIVSTEWEFEWIKVNQDLDPTEFSRDVSSDPNVVIALTDCDKIKGQNAQ